MERVTHNCRWVVIPAKNGVAGVYCGAPVKYHMDWDGDEEGSTKVRKYDLFCAEHMVKAAAMEEDEDEEDLSGYLDAQGVWHDFKGTVKVDKRGRTVYQPGSDF